MRDELRRMGFAASAVEVAELRDRVRAALAAGVVMPTDEKLEEVVIAAKIHGADVIDTFLSMLGRG